MSIVYLLLGTNLGDKRKNIQSALDKIAGTIGEITIQSSVYETAAWGNTNQDSFYNLVIEVKTDLQPLEVLARIFEIEKSLGRIREAKWEPRIIDIDILYFDNLILETETLSIPHPLLHKRRFTLMPLAEVAPEYIHPLFQQNNLELLNSCEDELDVKLVEK